MARRMTKVDRRYLEEAVQEAEKNGPLANLDELWRKAADIYNHQLARLVNCDEEGLVPISHSVAYLRANEWHIPRKTVAGKKGRAAGVPMDPEHKRKMLEAGAAARAAGGGRNAKIKNHPQREESRLAQLAQLENNNAMRFAPLVELAVDGNRRAQDKLFCLGCVGYQTAEVRRCCDIGCSKWLGRPFQKAAENATAEEMEASDVDVEEAAVA